MTPTSDRRGTRHEWHEIRYQMITSGRGSPYQSVVNTLQGVCAAAGLDLVRSLQVGWYNDRVAAEHRLPDYGKPQSLVVLIGNTSRLWPRFLIALRENAGLIDLPDPLDAYVEHTVGNAVDKLPLAAQIRWAHRAEPHHISFQTLATAAGMAWLSPASLSIHPVYGPWIALRAAVVLPTTGPAASPQSPPPCTHCDAGCRQKLAVALKADTWQSWLAVRDACPIGRSHRYPDDQIRYHYSKSRELLRTLTAAAD